MSFYFDQPTSSGNAELGDIMDDQQFDQAYNFTLEEEIMISENSELDNIMNDNQQFDQPLNFKIKEETMMSENAELENNMDDNQQFDQPPNFRMEEEIQIFDEINSIEPNYSTLLSMFPNVDSKYIRQICIKPPFDKEEGNSLVMLINHLLSYEEKIDETLISELHDDQNQISEGNMLSEDLLHLIEEEEQEKNKTLNDQILSEMLETQDREAIEEQKLNEKLLNEQLFSEFLEQDKTAVNEKMQILENILPDADPNVLREFVEKNHENALSLEEFVESNLQNKNYQKRDQYYARLRTKEKIEEYTTGFNVERFIKQFPEPFEHFENPEREGTKQEKALNFLINRYNFDVC